jgi:hypothetical protein
MYILVQMCSEPYTVDFFTDGFPKYSRVVKY